MKPVSNNRRRKSGGHVMIEVSFIFIVFFAMLIGVFDFGQFLFVHQALTERAREAARNGMANDWTNNQIQNFMLYGQTGTGSTGYFGLNSSMVTVTQSDANTWNWRINIQVSNYPYKILSPFIAGTYIGPNINVTVPLGEFD
jgi:Flp pilus assembly protein TadG